ncbi:hypothetical protein F4553_000691 [Allocatelliglobosispora scoriae]|uniref:Uncharacterized protein n=1 Tax=Allocatelliglobosispora scoriae TaxID=643052 RepID=A0A841BKN3_9ACTN|nr:hypothetical protein [Allocatelliglobosispora scoriae]MBB5867312.1 hypothetical protein [Allocatelliglobosispora scoriae]
MAVDTITDTEEPEASTGVKTEVYLGLLWLGITVFTAYASLHGAPGGTGALGAAVAAMPDVLSASLITAASIAGAAASRYAGAGRRLLVGFVAGAAFGLVTAVGVRLAYGPGTSVTMLAITVAVACVLGGAFAILPEGVLGASLWAMTWVLFAGLILSVLKPNLLTVLGGGPAAAQAAQATAETRFLYLQPVVAGLLAAMHSVRALRADDPALFWFPVAGALPGLYLLATEGLGHLGGTSLSATPDGAVGEALLTDPTKIRYAVIVLAVGGLLGLLIGARRPK